MMAKVNSLLPSACHATLADGSGLILLAEGRFHLETGTKPLKLPERVLTDFSKCALKSLDNRADFDSAIPRFAPSNYGSGQCRGAVANCTALIENERPR